MECKWWQFQGHTLFSNSLYPRGLSTQIRKHPGNVTANQNFNSNISSKNNTSTLAHNKIFWNRACVKFLSAKSDILWKLFLGRKIVVFGFLDFLRTASLEPDNNICCVKLSILLATWNLNQMNKLKQSLFYLP